MSNETRASRQQVSSSAQGAHPFVWPLSKSPTTPDELNTSYGPRIDADRWDFHDGLDLPAAVGTPIHAMADGVVHRAGPADHGFGSTHVVVQVGDPTDGQNNLFLVYLHLDSIAEGVIPGAQVHQGDVLGAVGQEDATYPHLHCEFRKGGPEQSRSVHPLHYLPYLNTANITQLRLDGCNFYRRDNSDKRAVRLRFDALDRREGDVQGVAVELSGEGDELVKLHVDFDDRDTINSAKGDEQAFKNGIAVEGYQKSNLKGEGLSDLHYGVILEDITPEFTRAKLQVLDVRNGQPETAEFALPALGVGEEPVNSRVSFESQTFPPRGWTLHLLPGNVCRPDEAAALTDSRGLLCQDLQSLPETLIRAGLRFALPVGRSPVRPMSWRLRADIQPALLQMDKGLVLHPLAFLIGDDVVAAACLRKIRNDKIIAGVLIRSADGLFRERIDVNEGEIFRDDQVRWELELVRVGTRQTTAILRLNNSVVARINGDTTGVEPDAGCVGILHRHSGLQITLHVDQLLLTEALR
jgi:hypothetical protein